MMGSNAYKNKAVIAGNGPMPNNGIIKPSNAMLGMVCKTPAISNTIPAAFFLFVMKIPSGKPISTAMSKEIKVRPICAIV